MSTMPLNDPVLQRDHTIPQERPAGSGWRAWVISVGIHGILLLVMYGIYWVVTEPATEYPVHETHPLSPMKPPPQKHPVAPEPTPLVLTPIENVEETPVVMSDVPDITEVESNSESESQSEKGRETSISNSEDGASGLSSAIGPQGGDAGNHGIPNETTIRKHHRHYRFVTKDGEDAVDRALRWFKRHQSPNGMWDAIGYFQNCTDAGGKCEPGIVNHGTASGANIAMTGYALLCFLSAGYDSHTPSQYRKVVVSGLQYLLSVQKADGYLGDRNYEHAVATAALAEAYTMSDDPLLKGPAQKAVDQIVAHQNPDSTRLAGGYGSGLGWDYVGPSNRNDSSVTGWNIMALKDALGGQLSIGTSLDSCKVWLDKVWKTQNANWASLDPYTGESRFPYTYDTLTGSTEISQAPAAGQISPQDHDLTCVGGICSVFLGHHAGDPMLETLGNYIINHQLPSQYPCNTYYMYYNTMTMFQIGGSRWMKWDNQVRDMLVHAQRRDPGCFSGSWDSQGTMFPGNEIGRVLSTAYCCLSLEVYYRHERLLAHVR